GQLINSAVGTFLHWQWQNSSSSGNYFALPVGTSSGSGNYLLAVGTSSAVGTHHWKVEGLKNANADQQLKIIKLKARVKKLERLNKVKSSKLRRLKKVGTSQRVESSEDVENVFNQGRISVDMETNEGIKLEVGQENYAETEGRQADTQAKIYNIDLDHSSKVLSMQEDTEVQEAVKVMTTAKLITEVVTAAATQVVAASAPIPAAKPKVLKIAAAPAVSTRKRKGVLSEEAQEAENLRGFLEIVQDKDDDVFVEAIPLAQNVPVVDYQRNQKSVHGLALVKRWKLLTSCGVHVIILSTVHLFLLVERRYPLSRFTLEQLVNVARLQVEEESEMSLELLKFTRQQLLEY
nr:hypothetical protein [Tanacetum cinerariifolium]